MLTHVDLNSDMGEQDSPEGLAIEAAMMPLITSVNIACGAHAGTPELMRRTASLAAQHGVAIGAHPGFHDRASFGRTAQSLPPHEIQALVVNQLKALGQVLAQDHVKLRHVKVHGALYNMAATDPEVARAVVAALEAVDPTLALYALAGSELVKTASRAGLAVVGEAFADRAYLRNGTLLPRSATGALLRNETEVRCRIRELIDGYVTSVDGATVPIQADSICIHADTPRAVSLARVIREELESAGIRVAGTSHGHV
jgi:UPF0271 protein